MTTETISSSDRILRQQILGSRRVSNYLLATVVTIGGVVFLLDGLSSYLHKNLLFFSDPSQLIFVPQGIAMGFYGVAGSLLATYLWLMIILDVGGGYNEFNRETGFVKIFRWGFPGKNRRIELVNAIADVQAVRAEIKEGVNPKRALYLKIKQRRDIPLTRAGQPVSLAELENQGAELARFLGVPLEGL